MDLKPDERIIRVSIWISKLGFSTGESFYRGRLVRLSVLTSRQLKTVQRVKILPKDSYIAFKFQENKLENLVC